VITIAAGACGPTTPPFGVEDAGNGYSARLWTGSCLYHAIAWDRARERSQVSKQRKLGARKPRSSLECSLQKSAAEVGKRHLLNTDVGAFAQLKKCGVVS
jgi:hypothetical protein